MVKARGICRVKTEAWRAGAKKPRPALIIYLERDFRDVGEFHQSTRFERQRGMI
jgi:hypothetical protein